jgi:transposase-like protein
VDSTIGENTRQEYSMDKPKGTRRKRRSFTKEFKAEAARLCRVGDRSIAQVAKDLDLSENALRQWVKQAEVDEGNGLPEALTSEERKELTRLRRENRQLQMEREILKKAAAFFAKEST